MTQKIDVKDYGGIIHLEWLFPKARTVLSAQPRDVNSRVADIFDIELCHSRQNNDSFGAL